MKELALPELIKTLSTPEKQPMDVLMASCKQAAAFIKNEQVIWKKGAEFAKLFTGTAPVVTDMPEEPADEEKPAPREAATETERPPEVVARYTKGQFNIYITGLRPVAAGGANKLEQLRTLREASGELNSAPRMTLQKANELIADLELGDRAILVRTTTSNDDALEIVKDLARVGLLAEVRN
jgi:hypothetical protein